MNVRDRLVAEAVGIVTGGSSLDLIGDRASGRTHVLRELASSLEEIGWRTTTVRASASLQSNALAALGLTGIGVRNGRASIVAAAEDLGEQLPRGRSAVLVDDWNDLDETTWGVLTSAWFELGLPIVTTKLRTRSGLTPTGLPASTRIPSQIVELRPLRFDELGSVLADRLAAPFEPSTLARVYAQSGGNVGMALALAEAAVREERLVQREGLWTAARELWSPSLSLLFEPVLMGLGDGQRDLLEAISMLGAPDIETLAALPAGVELARLEERSLVGLYPSGDRWVVSIQPPMLAEYLRHSPMRSRREALLSSAFPTVVGASGRPALPVSALGDGAQFARIVQDRQRAAAVAARAAWRNERTLDSAVRCIDALMNTSTSADELDELFEASAMLDGPSEVRGAWELAFAEHRAFVKLDPVGAIERLRAQALRLGADGAPLLARSVEIEQSLLGSPDLEPLERLADGDLGRYATAVHRAIAYVLTCRGRIDDSERHLAAIRGLRGTDPDPRVATIAWTNLFARGSTAAAMRICREGMAEARAGFDAIALRAYAEGAAFCAMVEGEYAVVDEVMDAVLTVGDPLWRPPFAQLSMTLSSAVVAMRRGTRNAARQRVDEAERIPLPDGPLPGQQRGLAYTQDAAAGGDLRLAADIATDTADQLWERGAYLAAAIGYAGAIEFDPTPERVAAAHDRVAQVEGAFVAEFFDYGRAIVDRDADRLAQLAEEFAAASRHSIALSAYERAAAFFDATGRETDADTTRRAIARLRAELAPGTYDPARFHAVVVELTDREREIARLAVAGLTNQQIADELVLSVRTVESHLHRIMRKTQVDRRADLAPFVTRAGGR